jgi:hypothetical protein
MQLREKLFSALMPPREPHVVDERVESKVPNASP